MNQTGFTLVPFDNRAGSKSWRLSGWLSGVRIRRNFKTREEAAAEKASLELRALHATSGLRVVATSLKDDQIREAEALFKRLEGKAHPMSFYVDFALTNYLEPEKRKPLPDAIREYVSAKEHEYRQAYISRPQYKRIDWELARLQRHFRGQRLDEISPTKLITFLEIGQYTLKTYNNRRGVYSTFFKYAFHRGWVAENPVLRVPSHRLRKTRGTAKTFTAAQARELMAYFETFEGGRWIPYFALCLFAGIRPGVPDGEITKITPDAVRLDAGFIHISCETSKVREPRKITVQPNLVAWLKAYPITKYPIVVADFKKRREKFKDRFFLTHDVMRHTFISMFVAKFRSLGEAALQAGNSEAIIRKHYLDLKSKEEAEEFFSILPKQAGKKRPKAPASMPTVSIQEQPVLKVG
jgi:integrase